MKKSVELPIVEPLFGTYHYQCGCATIEKNPSIRNWYLNNSLVLNCHSQFLHGATAPIVSVNNTYTYLNPCFEKECIPIKHIAHVHSLLRSLVDDGFYVYFNEVDDYYMKGKSWYKKRHFNHDGLICGYDRNDETYSIFAYDQNWRYRVFRTPQHSLSEGIKSGADGNRYCTLYAYRPIKDKIEIDAGLICRNIEEYLDSSFEKYPVSESDAVFGNIVHDYIAMYLDCLLEEKIPYSRMDWRIFRSVWEHKKTMGEALHRAEEKLGLCGTVSGKYSRVIKMADDMRALYASYHMKRRDSLLPVISKLLCESKKIEDELLREFCEAVKGAMKL